MEMVKCEVCGEVMTAKDASAHVKETGHNLWTLLISNICSGYGGGDGDT